MIKEKKAYPIQHIVNWYFGNYCARKCFDKCTKLREHYSKLNEFAEKNPNLKMTHKEFLELFNNHMTICTLDDDFKRKMIGWKLFRILQQTPNYDSDKIIVEEGILKTREGLLEKPVQDCMICKKLGIRW